MSKSAPFTVADTLPKLCTVEKTCQALDISAATFYALRASGAFPIPEVRPRIGRGPRFAGKDIQRYLDNEFADVIRPSRRRSA